MPKKATRQIVLVDRHIDEMALKTIVTEHEYLGITAAADLTLCLWSEALADTKLYARLVGETGVDAWTREYAATRMAEYIASLGEVRMVVYSSQTKSPLGAGIKEFAPIPQAIRRQHALSGTPRRRWSEWVLRGDGSLLQL